MKAAGWKEQDRALSERAKGFSVAWDSLARGTFNAGRNAKKREARAKWKADRVWFVYDCWHERMPKLKRFTLVG